jgi:hypothetical protein
MLFRQRTTPSTLQYIIYFSLEHNQQKETTIAITEYAESRAENQPGRTGTNRIFAVFPTLPITAITDTLHDFTTYYITIFFVLLVPRGTTPNGTRPSSPIV